ncbi:dihydrofolate synthase [Porphyromonas macacae]|uniref:Dihydrofolate synthase/folylpolyglutamate synthase n=1 Tax=Porphyromonas macacae TaxID=28115 RepID=A0A0A2E279_9PORP|nr:folylpolyglutamate synthase/dihydrofolate synthase family protein [Porphyromonas macacae]KGN72998.1 dihydrofolate synthase [Porphyromonas macacae]SUB89462.1 Bifunctional protein folC [Porphyromonas macacae]
MSTRYEEAVEFLYNSTPVFQHVGASAYKPGLDTVLALDRYYDYPHRTFRSIHVAGTNGKGSTCHTLASVFQEAGYKVGLFTSPHLVDFRERIRVNGEMISEDYVCNFVDTCKPLVKEYAPSFFELTTLMAFCYFRDCNVDYAIIEVGMGGRLDSTNIISPILSIITNISLDHTQFLGKTLPAIASEKAGIIKEGIPAVIGEAEDSNVRNVFIERAAEVQTEIFFADQLQGYRYRRSANGRWQYTMPHIRSIDGELMGEVQWLNARTVLMAIEVLSSKCGVRLSVQEIIDGFARVTRNTGLMGRWQIIQNRPLVVCDTAHNEGGIKEVVAQLEHTPHCKLHIVFGMVSDKDVDAVLRLLPQDAVYYFISPNIKRALDAEELSQRASVYNLRGETFNTIAKAYETALAQAKPEDIIYVGGSNFVVSEFIIHLKKL